MHMSRMSPHSVAHMCEGPRKAQAEKVLGFLLSTQFIMKRRRNKSGGEHESEEEKGIRESTLWRVSEGSGMGLPHSGEVADAAFHWKVEHRWATRPRVQQAFGVRCYARSETTSY